jgi:hypothetical protein
VAKEGTNRATFLLQQLNKFNGILSEDEVEEVSVKTETKDRILSLALIEAEDINPLIGLTQKDFLIFSK